MSAEKIKSSNLLQTNEIPSSQYANMVPNPIWFRSIDIPASINLPNDHFTHKQKEAFRIIKQIYLIVCVMQQMK